MADPSSNAPTVQAPPAHELVGSTISGRYKIEALLGSGGMGAVYLVQHIAIRKRFALKMLHAETSQNPELVARFEREAMAAANVDHPNIAVATDFGRAEDGAFFLVLEYLEGRRLRDALADGPLEVRRAVHIAEQVASALERSHELGIVHRDLKPENIMLISRQGDPDFVKVLDFGLAKVAPETLAKDGHEPGQALTKHGTVFGTPKYMAPEQCVSGAIDGRTDLYALGVILYEMLTGVNPFSGKDIVATIRNQLSMQTPPMKTVAANVPVPAALEAMAKRLTAKIPDDRFPNAKSVLAALAEVSSAELPALAAPSAKPDVPAASPPLKGAEPVAKTVMSVDLVSVEDIAPKEQSLDPAATPAADKPAEPAPTPAKRPTPEIDKRLQQFLERLPPPLQKQPALLFIPLALLVLFLFLLIHSGGSNRSMTAKPEAPGPHSLPAGAEVPRAQFEQAVTQGQPALLILARQFPTDVRVLRAVAHTYMAQHDGLEALRWLGKVVAIDARPSVVQDGEIVQAVMLAPTTPDVLQDVIGLLENGLGSRGSDALYSLATRPGPSRVRMKFNQSLAKVTVRTHASPSTRIAIDLRIAEQCDAKQALLARAAKDGDARTLQQLQALTQTRNCGPYGLGDCWSCLRQDGALQSAISAILARTQPSH